MNKDNAHLYLPVIQGFIDGKTIQINAGDNSCPNWQNKHGINIDFTLAPEFYRVKPEPVIGWFRVAETHNGLYMVRPRSIHTEKSTEEWSDFIRWLTPRTEYEVTE